MKSCLLAQVVVMLCFATNAHALDIEKMVMPGEVIAGHADIEGDCSDCHAAFARDRQNELCIDCHQLVGADIQAGRGFHGLSPDAGDTACVACHTEHRGRDAKIAAFDTAAFDHLLTDFELRGKHTELVCKDCHSADELYREAPSACIDCHRDDDVHHGELGDDCASCHVADDWPQVEFNHATETGYALRFGHAGLTCDSCHVSQSFNQAPTTCVGCHADDDTHAGLLGNDCASCHDERRWDRSRFRHNVFTDFPLRGAHSELACEACHADPVTVANPGTACIDCHRADDVHEGTLGDNCASCHNESVWPEDIRFDHDFTLFPLLGAHQDAECSACHETARFSDAPGACIDCHAADDVHEGSLGTDCVACHAPADWSVWRFDHFVMTDFPLDGEHEGLACVACHTAPSLPGQATPSHCIDCHRSDDVHAGQFGRDCGRCHTTRTFRGEQQP